MNFWMGFSVIVVGVLEYFAPMEFSREHYLWGNFLVGIYLIADYFQHSDRDDEPPKPPPCEQQWPPEGYEVNTLTMDLEKKAS